MKTNNLWLLIIAIFVSFSCTNDDKDVPFDSNTVELTKNEVLSIAYYDTKEPNESDIIDMVKSFSQLDNAQTTRGSISSFNVENKSYINVKGEFEEKEIATRSVASENEITSDIYNVTFKNGSDEGLAVVATYMGNSSVIAFVPKYTEESMEKSGAAEILQASKASYLYEAIKTKELVDSLRMSTLEKISAKLNIPIGEITYEKIEKNIILVDASTSTRVTPVQGPPRGIITLNSSIKPMVTTNWDQGNPYNIKFPGRGHIGKVSQGNGRFQVGAVPVGCVNIAIAQIMTWTHRFSFQTYPIPGEITIRPDYDHMTRKPKITDPGTTDTGYMHTASLLLYLYERNNTQPDQKDSWGYITGSNVSEPNMLRTMNELFKLDPKADFNGDRVWWCLREAKSPVLVLTSDHAFVISGMLITEMDYSTRQLVKTNDVYWHANFGWGNESTGYYKLNSEAKTYFEAGGTNIWCYKQEFIGNLRMRN